jgi:hypothetical protein
LLVVGCWLLVVDCWLLVVVVVAILIRELSGRSESSPEIRKSGLILISN